MMTVCKNRHDQASNRLRTASSILPMLVYVLKIKAKKLDFGPQYLKKTYLLAFCYLLPLFVDALHCREAGQQEVVIGGVINDPYQ
jgi:hypothetical protein